MMVEQFEVDELVKVAVEDEKSGVAYYSRLAQKACDAWLRSTFADLAEQEKHHQQRFERMLADLGGYSPREQYPGEYMAYLRAMTSGRAFPDVHAAQQAAEQCADDLSAVDMALRFERDTLVLMNELRGFVPQRDRAIVDELINEERSHVVVLTAAKEKMS
jgi:rubrerythrin